MKPEDANPRNFQQIGVVYYDGDFAIVYGRYDSDPIPCLAVRWNGDPSNPNDKGFPIVFNNPMWTVIPTLLTIPILTSILSNSITSANIIDISMVNDIIKGKI